MLYKSALLRIVAGYQYSFGPQLGTDLKKRQVTLQVELPIKTNQFQIEDLHAGVVHPRERFTQHGGVIHQRIGDGPWRDG
ncbi:hypothetical protein D3C75_1115910 [compost metagenome]